MAKTDRLKILYPLHRNHYYNWKMIPDTKWAKEHVDRCSQMSLWGLLEEISYGYNDEQGTDRDWWEWNIAKTVYIRTLSSILQMLGREGIVLYNRWSEVPDRYKKR